MKKVLSVIEKEIAKYQYKLASLKETISGSTEDINAYSKALDAVKPTLEELKKLEEVKAFILQEPSNTPKSTGKRGRPKKNL